VKLLSKHDPRAAFILKADPRVHFALISGAGSGPLVNVFSPKTLEEDLTTVTQGFLQDEIEIDRTTKEITLPKMFYHYPKDFGKNDTAMLNWIYIYLSGPRKDVSGCFSQAMIFYLN
jgi:hypothetical protein